MEHGVFWRRFATRLCLAPLLILLVVFSGTAISVAHAESGAYSLPLEGIRWTTNMISVSIPTAPEWAHDAVVDALNTRVQAQHWFADNYFPAGKTYDFNISSRNNESTIERVLVRFIDGNESYAGRADITYKERSRAITLANVSLPQSFEGKTLDSTYRPWFTTLAVRVFGHVIGLDWAAFCDVMQPVTDASCSANSPSTLDHYAVHILAEGSIPSNVTLPPTIPYAMMPQVPVESSSFPMVLLLASLGLVSCSVVGVRKRAGASSDDQNSEDRPREFLAENQGTPQPVV